VFSFYSTIGLGYAQVGLAPSPQSQGRAEAVTAAAYGTDALFYNPATLPYSRLQIGLVGVEGTVGIDEAKLVPYDSHQDFLLSDYLSELAKQGEVFSNLTSRVIDFSAPYVGVSSFASLTMSARDRQSDHQYNVCTDVGVIAGGAIKIHKTSIGYSQYQLVRAEVEFTPSLSQLESIVELTNQNNLSAETMPFAEFTTIKYGGAKGHNIGFMQYWWDDNPSGIGVALLNAGVTKFAPQAPVQHEEVDKFEEELALEAQTYGIEVQTPDSIPQMLNVGVTLGLGGETNDWFDARIGIDGHDVAGDVIEHKLAASYDVGLTLPDRIALIASTPLLNTNWLARIGGGEPSGEGHIIHMGLLNIRAFGGVRESSHYSRGAAIGFHFGYERLVSLLRLDIEGFESYPLGSSDYIPRRGVRARLGLTLIF
jgi:hypothetical protein